MAAPGSVRVYVGLGANLGDAAATMADAVESLGRIPHVTVGSVSPLYATAPWGVTDQPEFRNAAIALDLRASGANAEAAALDLLGRLKSLERRAGRQAGPRWGPRPLDLDLLVFGRHRIDVERSRSARSIDAGRDRSKAAKRLQIPHRDLGERLFVLAPLADLAPRLVPPGWTETVETRRRVIAAAEPPGSVRVVGEWDPIRRSWRPVSSRRGAGSAARRARTSR